MNNMSFEEPSINDTDDSKFWVRVLIFFYEKLFYGFCVGVILAVFSVSYHRFYNADNFLIGHCICCSLLMFYLFNRLQFPYHKLHYTLIYLFVFLTSWINVTSKYSIEFIKNQREFSSELSSPNKPQNLLCWISYYIVIIIMLAIGGGMIGGTLYLISQDIDVLFWSFLEKISQGSILAPNPPNEVLNFIIFYGLVSIVFVSFSDGFSDGFSEKLAKMRLDNSYKYSR